MAHSLIANPGDFVCEVAEPWAQRLRMSVRPLFQACLASQLEGLGTALLLKQSGHRLLVTAKHVPEDAWEDGTAVYGGLLEGDDIEELPDRVAGYQPPNDVGVFVGAEALLQNLPAANFLDLNRDVAQSPPISRFCFVLAYRAAKRAVNVNANELEARSEMFFYCNTVQEGNDTTFYVPIDYKKVRHGGMRQQTGELNGISGGAVFGFDPLRPNVRPLLIGVVIRHPRRERHLVCTKAAVIHQLVRQVQNVR